MYSLGLILAHNLAKVPIVKIDTPQGEADAWDYDLTFTYNKNLLAPDTLDVSGKLQHIRAPHPAEGEIPKAPALSVQATLTQPNPIPPGLNPVTVNGPLDKQRHIDGTHFDSMTQNKLEVTCCTQFLGNFSKWNYRLVAEHPETPPPPVVPEPLTILGTGFAAAALPALKRVHKKAKK